LSPAPQAAGLSPAPHAAGLSPAPHADPVDSLLFHPKRFDNAISVSSYILHCRKALLLSVV
jgi:hypothetical protein